MPGEHSINYAKLRVNSSNAPFCNLYNRKCDFSPLRAAWRPDFFVMGSRAVPLRFDTLAGSKLARRILSGCCRALRCVPVSRCTACLLACNAADLALPFGCSCGRATSAAFCHGYRVPAYLAGDVRQTVHADHCDGFDQALAARYGSTDAAS